MVYHSAGHITSPVTFPQNTTHYFQRVVTSQPQCQITLKKIGLFWQLKPFVHYIKNLTKDMQLQCIISFNKHLIIE